MACTADVKEVVRVNLGEIIERGLESFLDLLAEKTGHELLMDINYKIVGHESDTLLIEVTGCVEQEEDDGADAPAAS